jgi:hypothetical protein
VAAAVRVRVDEIGVVRGGLSRDHRVDVDDHGSRCSCVTGTAAHLTAVFSGRSRRAGTELVLTTAPGYARRGIHTGSRAAAFRRAYPNRRPLGSGLFLASPRSHVLFWVMKGRVRFVALVGRRVQRHPRRFTHDLRAALL